MPENTNSEPDYRLGIGPENGRPFPLFFFSKLLNRAGIVYESPDTQNPKAVLGVLRPDDYVTPIHNLDGMVKDLQSRVVFDGMDKIDAMIKTKNINILRDWLLEQYHDHETLKIKLYPLEDFRSKPQKTDTRGVAPDTPS